MLHCICRKPYDESSMIACGKCGEWYHIECVKLVSPQKVYICAACMPGTENLVSASEPLDDDRYVNGKNIISLSFLLSHMIDWEGMDGIYIKIMFFSHNTYKNPFSS